MTPSLVEVAFRYQVVQIYHLERRSPMAVSLSSSADLMQSVPYHHVAVGTGTRHVHVSGQIARDAAGNAVAAGDLIGEFMAGIEAVSDELAIPRPVPPASLIGVDYLFEPDVLVEVEATAILD
jgi:enamine deaminase RidA (YjgF/YER057c/UK114 family)